MCFTNHGSIVAAFRLAYRATEGAQLGSVSAIGNLKQLCMARANAKLIIMLIVHWHSYTTSYCSFGNDGDVSTMTSLARTKKHILKVLICRKGLRYNCWVYNVGLNVEVDFQKCVWCILTQPVNVSMIISFLRHLYTSKHYRCHNISGLLNQTHYNFGILFPWSLISLLCRTFYKLVRLCLQLIFNI